MIVLGDHVGLSEDEVQMVCRLGAEVGGGGPVLRASLANGALLASHCVVIANHYLDTIHDCPSQLWQASAEVRVHTRQRQRRIKRKNAKRERVGLVAGVDSPEQSSEGDDAGGSSVEGE